MKNFVQKMTAGTALIAVVSLGLFAKDAQTITDGVDDEDGMYPQVCAFMGLFYGDYWSDGSGMLIHPRVVLTAGHVISKHLRQNAAHPWAPAMITFDYEVAPWDQPEMLEIAHLLRMPPNAGGYPGSAVPDVGVAILAEPVDIVALCGPDYEPDDDCLAKLPPIGFLDGGEWRHPAASGLEGIVVGYGSARDRGFSVDWDAADYRSYATVLPMAVGQTTIQLQMNPNLVDPDTGGGVCAGDSGGPLFYNDPETDTYAIGTTHSADASCMSYFASQRLDTPEVHAWIDDVLWDVENGAL